MKRQERVYVIATKRSGGTMFAVCFAVLTFCAAVQVRLAIEAAMKACPGSYASTVAAAPPQLVKVIRGR